MTEYNGRPVVEITRDMIAEARNLEGSVTVHRTKESPVDTFAGILGEFCFIEWLTGDWRNNHEVGKSQGRADFQEIVEIKTSAYPFRDTLNLTIREDYANKRAPALYVQTIIDVPGPKDKRIKEGTPVVIAGFADHETAVANPPRALPMGRGRFTRFRCYLTEIRSLRPMAQFTEAFVKAGGRLN